MKIVIKTLYLQYLCVKPSERILTDKTETKIFWVFLVGKDNFYC